MNNISEILGIKIPLIQAPMAGLQKAELAIEVSRAGALGSLPCALLSAEEISVEINKIKKAGVSSYNLNFFTYKPLHVSAEQELAWRNILKPYFQELGMSVDDQKTEFSRAPFNQDILEVIKQFKPPVISFHFGLPEDSLIEQLRSWNAKIVSTATTLEEALWLEAKGVDAIIAQGIEAGGHRGMFLTENLDTQIPLRELLADLSGKIKTPIIAAGGISKSSEVAEILKLGASAVQVGTAFLLCPEALSNELYRKSLQSAEEGETVISNVFTGRPARAISNRLIKEIGPINKSAPAFPMASKLLIPIRKKAESMGRVDFSSHWAGMGFKQCRSLPAREIIRMLVPD